MSELNVTKENCDKFESCNNYEQCEVSGKHDKSKKHDKSEKIKERESWLKVFVVVVVIGVLAFKILKSNIILDMSKFDFTALLSVIIAFFSIGLSVAFYFKASDTSNLFYDNTYKFTKTNSEILGRIEASFIEKFDSLNSGYTGIREGFDRLLSTTKTVEEHEREIEENKKNIDIETDEKKKIVDELSTKSNLPQTEIEEFIAKFEEKNNAVENYKDNIEYINERLYNLKNDYNNECQTINKYIKSENTQECRTKLKRKIRQILLNDQEMLMKLDYKLSDDLLNIFFSEFIDKCDDNLLQIMYNQKIIDKNRKLTRNGANFIRNITCSYQRSNLNNK